MTLTLPTANLTPAQPAKNTEASNTLQLAAKANGLAKESLTEIDKLVASAQDGDSFSLQKLQTLAKTALSETSGLQAAGGSDIAAILADTGYLAQAALQKIGTAQSSGIAKGGRLHAVA